MNILNATELYDEDGYDGKLLCYVFFTIIKNIF